MERDKTRVMGSLLTAVARLFPGIDLCRSVYGGGWMLWRRLDGEDSSHNILTLDALQVCLQSQVTLELSMSMRIQPICLKSTYMQHTYGGPSRG
jgi:hypothetical protein